MRLALPVVLLLASCGAAPPPTSASTAGCAREAQAPTERVTAASDLRPRPPPRAPGEPLEIPRDWRALPGTPILWRGPHAREVLVADAHTVIAISDDCITALAVDDGSVRWSEARPRIDRFRGHVLAGSGRVLLGRPDGLVARDAASGSVVWQLDLASDDAWLDHPSIHHDVLTAQVERGETVSYWQIDSRNGRVVSREPCDDRCVSGISAHSAVRHAGSGVWEGHDANSSSVVWTRTLGEGSPLASVDGATLVVASGAIQRIAHRDGATEWSVPIPEEARTSRGRALTAELGHVDWLPSTLAGHTLFVTLDAPVPLLLGIDVRDGAVVTLQTLAHGERHLEAIDEQTSIAVDDQWRVVTIDLRHTVASPRETLSLEQDIGQLARMIVEGSAPANAAEFVSRMENAETAPALVEALSTAALPSAARLARALGRAREPTVRSAVLELLHRTAIDPLSDEALLARIEVADLIQFPLDEPHAMREVAVFEGLLRTLRATRDRDPRVHDAMRATRDLVERTSSASASLRAMRATFGSSPPTCELTDREEIELAATRHVVELESFTEVRGESTHCAALRSIFGPVARSLQARCAVTGIVRAGDAHAAGELWSDAPGAYATFVCSRVPGWDSLRLRLVDGTWRVVSAHRYEFWRALPIP